MCVTVRSGRAYMPRICHVGAEQLDLPRIGAQVAADLIKQSGLAGTIRTDDQAALALPYRERYVLRYDEAAKCLLQVDDFKRMTWGAQGHRDPPRRPIVNLLSTATKPVRLTNTINRNTRPTSRFHPPRSGHPDLLDNS